MQSKLLDVRSLKDETSLTIANEVKETLKKRMLFDKCISFTGDNCNTNFGGIHRKRGNNVFTHLKSEVPAFTHLKSRLPSTYSEQLFTPRCKSNES